MSELFQNTLAYHFGPVASLFKDPEVSEILINGPKQIYCERGGRLEACPDLAFEDEMELMAACTNIAQYTGNVLSQSRPRIDGRLPDGARVHIVIPPLAPSVSLAIRRFQSKHMAIEDLVDQGALNHGAAHFLKVAVEMKQSILVSGGTGSGKTTFLNALSGFVPDNEREGRLSLNQAKADSIIMLFAADEIEEVIFVGNAEGTYRFYDGDLDALREAPEGWDATWTTHGVRFVSALRRQGVWLCQFHPELSGTFGADIIKAWLNSREEQTCEVN